MKYYFVCILISIIKAFYAIVIYYKCNDKKILVALSVPFPIITGIICAAKYRKNVKDAFIIIIALIIFLVSGTAVSFAFREKYYDKDGTVHIYLYDVSFTDTEGNRYSYDYNKAGYEYLYINSTEKYLEADYCYLDSEGYLHYDEDKSITAKDESCCVDEDGTIYYPAKFTSFNKDGTIKYSFNSANFEYDRFGNAYTFEYIPYYDSEGNKFFLFI
ncbi:MAG: hypothetical protein NC397_08070 [Clostridium sp.]|nr:hypothetical protein [Clostridium sp.]